MSSTKSNREQRSFHFVIFGSQTYYNIAWNAVRGQNDVQYIDSLVSGQSSWLSKLLVRACFNLRLKRWIPSFIEKQIYRRAFHFQASDKPYCFLFFECWYAVYTTTYMDYLKQTYPNARFALYLQDLVKSNPLFDITVLRDRFDVIYSYDQHDAQQYELHYMPTPYSALDGLQIPHEPSYDLFFCGHAKNRLNEIMTVYDQAQKAGLNCVFYITGVTSNQMRQTNDIIYNQPITYTDYLNKAMQSRCIVEIMQHDADGYTPRLWEAITYNKHLLTNNKSILSSAYTHNSIHYIANTTIHWDWIHTPATFPTTWREQLSPIHCLNQMDHQLK